MSQTTFWWHSGLCDVLFDFVMAKLTLSWHSRIHDDLFANLVDSSWLSPLCDDLVGFLLSLYCNFDFQKVVYHLFPLLFKMFCFLITTILVEYVLIINIFISKMSYLAILYIIILSDSQIISLGIWYTKNIDFEHAWQRIVDIFLISHTMTIFCSNMKIASKFCNIIQCCHCDSYVKCCHCVEKYSVKIFIQKYSGSFNYNGRKTLCLRLERLRFPVTIFVIWAVLYAIMPGF